MTTNKKFNVLNANGERIVVTKIDINIHRHLTGRMFTEDEACINKEESTIVTEENLASAKDLLKDPVQETVKPKVEEKISAVVETETTKETLVPKEEMTEEEAREKYRVKFGRRPSPNMKLENILIKIK